MIGERLLDLRKDAGLTQDDLAEVLFISKHSISSYERDKSEPPDSVKIKIAKFFNVSIDYLLGVVDAPVAYDEHRDSLRLPKEFPEKAKEELLDYANYLICKYNKK